MKTGRARPPTESGGSYSYVEYSYTYGSFGGAASFEKGGGGGLLRWPAVALAPLIFLSAVDLVTI